MKIGFKQVVLTTALAGLVAPAALAQSGDNPFQRGRYVAVTDRQQSEFDPLAIRAGAFEVLSRLAATAEYNDNVYALENNEIDDTVVRIVPQVDVRSTWSSHELRAGASVDHNEYVVNDSETTTNYNAYVAGRVDVRRTFQINGQIDAGHFTEPRYEPAGSTSVDPVESDRLGANVGATFRNDRLMLEASGGTREDDYSSGSNDRDVTENWVSGRASYAVSPDVALFVQGRNAELDYASPGTVGNPNRDGSRSSVQVGVNFELEAPFRGEIAVGSFKEEKDAATRPDFDGLSLTGRLLWFPTQLTTVTFNAYSGVFDPGIPTSASASDTRFGFRVDHELRRNIVVFGDVTFGKYDFEDIDREDDFTQASVGIGYKMNRNARIDLAYRLNSQDSSGAAADRTLDQNILSLGITLFP
jgi:hypothetical protein